MMGRRAVAGIGRTSSTHHVIIQAAVPITRMEAGSSDCGGSMDEIRK
jgi:hypothetical protein